MLDEVNYKSLIKSLKYRQNEIKLTRKNSGRTIIRKDAKRSWSEEKKQFHLCLNK